MLKGDLFSVQYFYGAEPGGSVQSGTQGCPDHWNDRLASGRAIPTDSETQPYLALGTLPQEHCAANARHSDTAPEAGLLLSSDIETK